MKNLIKFIVLVVVAAAALVSCQQEIGKDETSDENAISIRVYASADEVNSDNPSSKTYIDGTAIKWGTGEYMKIGVFDGEATEFGDSTDETADAWSGDAQAYFNFSITPANASGKYTYYGLYPASAAVASNNEDPTAYKVSLPASQSATASSYDPKAYILVARPDPGHDAANADWTAFFRRATALNKITLKNLSEDIKRVTITAPDGTYLAGARKIDLTTTNKDDVFGEIYNDGGRTNTVDVRYSTKLDGGADMDIWFTSWDASIPVDGHLVIVAYSDSHTFTRDITVTNKPITFKQGYLNTLNVNMSSAIQGLVDGNYLILANNSGTYYALKAEAESTRMNFESYAGSLDPYSGSSDIIWTVGTSDGVRTITNGGNYLGWSSGNTATLQAAGDGWTTTNYGMDITWKSDHYEIAVHSDNSRILAKNTGTYGFAFYNGSGYKNIVFVPATVDNRTAVTLTFDNDQVSLTPAEAAQYLGEDLTISPNVAAVSEHLTWDYEDNDGIIDGFENGAVTLTGDEGSATVTVSFAGDEGYLPANASYTITVAAASVAEPEWVETAITDLGASDVFVMVANGSYAISSAGGTSSNPPAVAVTVSGTKLTGDIADAIKWNISGNSSDGFTFYPNGETTKLFCNTNASSSSNTNLRVGAGGNYNRYLFVLDSDHIKTNDEYTARYIGINGTSDFRGYVSASTNSCTFKFYKYVAAQDNRQEAGMSWSSDSATATYSNGNSLSFTAPTLTPGNASGITYESTDETIATINVSGVVSITALSNNDVKEGSTTIKAVFAGDTNYKPQTVSYTLNVVDSRSAVATPGFSPAAGEVAADTEVSFTCADSDVTYHYTVNGSEPTTASASGSSVIIDEAKTVKVIATKTGYKPSAVATAAYTVAGVQANDGTLEHPYTVAEALAIIAGYSDKQQSASQVYVSGIIAQVGSYNVTYHSVTYDISDDGTTTNMLNIYSGKFVANTNFTSNEQIEVSDEVVVYGYLYLYGSTKEMYQNNYIYSLNGINKALTAGSLSTSKDDANKQITVTWGAATGTTSAISYVVNCGNQSHNANAAGSHTFTMADYGTYAISVVASAADAFSATATANDVTLSDPGSSIPDPETITFANLGLSNSVQYLDPFDGGNFTITFAGGGNDGKYYDSGNGMRTYGGGTITIASTHNISQISFTWSGNSYKPETDVASPTGYDTSTSKWTGEATSITLTRPSGNGHWRLQSVTVTYAD